MTIEVYDKNPKLVVMLEQTYSKEFPGLVMISVLDLDLAIEIAKRDPRPTIIVFGFIAQNSWDSDARILALNWMDCIHFIDAPLDTFRVKNAWRYDHGQDPLPDLSPWLPKNSLPNPRAKKNKTKNP